MSEGLESRRLSPSVRLSVLAFALSTWFEGYSNLRNSFTTAVFLDTQLFSLATSVDPEASRQTSDASLEASSILNWIQKRGRQLSGLERSVMGGVDMLNSLVILRLIGARPLFPFLITPLLTTVPLPRAQKRVGHIRWSKIIIVSLALCVLRQLQRFLVASGVSICKHMKDQEDGIYKGRVVVRGSPLPPRRRTTPRSVDPEDDLSWMYESDAEEDQECIICAGRGGGLSANGNGGNTDLSQSISSHTSSPRMSESGVLGTSSEYSFGALPAGGSSPSSLGPLEAFCTRAPMKHVAHRVCILRWHAAYNDNQRSQRVLHIPGLERANEGVDVFDDIELFSSQSTRGSEDERALEARKLRRAKALLHLAGFDYLVDLLRPSNRTHNSGPTAGTGYVSMEAGTNATVSFTPSFTLSNLPRVYFASTSSARSSSIPAFRRHSHTSTMPAPPFPPNHLATLCTEWPPCPVCRSPVNLHFCSFPPQSSLSSTFPLFPSPSSLPFADILPASLLSATTRLATVMSAADLKRNTVDLVTGRTILLSLTAQLSFIITIISMLRARERNADYRAAMLALATNTQSQSQSTSPSANISPHLQ